MIMYTETPDAQRALLLHLDDLTTEQEHALDAGDMEVLTLLSEQRSSALREAAHHLPPYQAWDPALGELVSQVQERATHLQQQIQACMAAVRRELINLDRRHQMTQYLAEPGVPRQMTWKG